MKSKGKYYLVISLILVFLVLVYSFLFLLLSLRIKGKDYLTISYNEEYKDKGAECKFFGIDLASEIKTDNKVDTSKLGKYEVTYTVKVIFFEIERKRIVNVVDERKPIIEFLEEKSPTICPGEKAIEEYTAVDGYDGDLTDKVVLTYDGENKITYSVTDSSDNTYEVTREYKKEDKTAPELKLKGNSSISIKQNDKYNEPGYEVKDNCTKNLKVYVSGSVDTSKVGSYTLTYTAKDDYGNETKVSRKVTVYEVPETPKKDDKEYNTTPGVIYLTFDDGPSGKGTTKKILDVLKEENVHATFFVTCSGPDDLIKREFNEGHKMALHTKSHNYKVIYASSDNFFKDLYAVQDRVYKLTGYKSYISRFPGGSNNTVSPKGMMKKLRAEVKERGFTYFDWNVSADDAAGCGTSTCVYNHVIKDLSKKRENIVLMHDIKQTTADALKNIIKYGKENGYTFKVIDENTKPVVFR